MSGPFTLFGSDDPTLTQPNDAGAINVATAFKIVTETGWRALGVRFYVPTGTIGLPADGHIGYLWGGSPEPTTLLGTVTFSGVAAGQWNMATFTDPIDLDPGEPYRVSVYFPSGLYGVQADAFDTEVISGDSATLVGIAFDDIANGNGSYVYGGAGAAVTNGSPTNAWYGVDVLVDDGSSDTPTSVTATGTATDPLDATATDEETFTPFAGDARTIRKSMMENRINWGSAVDSTPRGPTILNGGNGEETFALQFTAMRTMSLVGANIFKAPDTEGTVTVTVWTAAGDSLGSTEVTWEADDGGWVEVTLDDPISLTAEAQYVIGYHSPTGDFAATEWIFNGQATCSDPFLVADFNAGVPARYLITATADAFPTTTTASNFYIDPIAEYTDTELGFAGDQPEYLAQWTNASTGTDVPFGVFLADAEFIQGYADMGINTIMAASTTQVTVDAIKTAGVEVYADSSGGTFTALQVAAEDSDYAALLKGYFVADEPDLVTPLRLPSTVRGWINGIRQRDSTRPVLVNLGLQPPFNQGFGYIPPPPQTNIRQVNDLWRDWAAESDVSSCDWYTLTTSNNGGGKYGVWVYANVVRRISDLTDGTRPVWGYIETTSQDPGEPTPDQVVKAVWACLIAGARGVVFFDHRFGDILNTQDFAAMLHDDDMKAAVTALMVLVQDLAAAINSSEASLVTAVTSSNTTQGPIGGTLGVPIHHTERVVGSTRYCFAQAIRPGTTTATFTAADVAGKTITVIGESRTLTADGDGIFTDDFAADYSVHLYSWGA